MRNITKQELKVILENHQKWLDGEEGGERADLSEANLTKANLSGAIGIVTENEQELKQGDKI